MIEKHRFINLLRCGSNEGKTIETGASVAILRIGAPCRRGCGAKDDPVSYLGGLRHPSGASICPFGAQKRHFFCGAPEGQFCQP